MEFYVATSTETTAIMKSSLKINMKANERLYVNGGILKVDRKVAVELLNDVVFLLESHVMAQEQATSPLRQLYFVVQSMLIEPKSLPLATQIAFMRRKMAAMAWS